MRYPNRDAIQGVTLIRLDEGDGLSVARVIMEDEEEEK